MFPPMSADGVVAAAFIPLDGYLDPSQLTFALADGARLLGADIEQRTRVTGINLRGGRVHEVVTDKGTIRTDVVVNAGGMYAPQIGRMVGVNVPIITYGHEFLVTEAFEPALAPLPTLRDPDRLDLLPHRGRRADHGRLRAQPGAVGARRRARRLRGPAAARGLAALRAAARGRGGAGAGDRSRPRCASSSTGPRRSPPTASSSWASPTCPASGSRPGSAPTAWPEPAGWAGRWPSGWSNGEPSLDLWHMDSRRFGRQYRSRDYTLARATEVYSTYYDIKYPNHERTAGRPLRLSPAYASLAELGASFGEKSGWERANWFEPNAALGDEALRPRGWAGQNWSPAITPRRWRRASGRGSSTRRRSPRSRSPGPAPPPTCSGCAQTTSTAPSAPSPTPRC